MTTATTAQMSHGSKRSIIDRFGGRLIRPDDADYDSSRTVLNGAIDRRPRLIARCIGTSDVLCPCIFGSTAEVGKVGTQKHDGKTSCYFNAAFLVNRGNYGTTKLDGMKFWFAGDKGDAKTVELTFEPSATKEQREGVRVFLSHFLPQKWTSLTEGLDAKIDWTADATHAAAKLDGGMAAEVVMSRFSGATGKGTTVIKNLKYFAATRNDGFNIMPVDQLAYRRGPKPAPFEFRGTSGWTITIDMDSEDEMDSEDVVAAR